MTTRMESTAFDMSPERLDFTCAAAGVRVATMGPLADTVKDAKTRDNIEIPKKYKVIVLNDNATPMLFVVELLQDVFRMDPKTATEKMLEVHYKGRAICGIYLRDIAEAKTAQVEKTARSRGYPLAATFEPE